MQCKPVSELPLGEKWTFEIKFDGYRFAYLQANSATLSLRMREDFLV